MAGGTDNRGSGRQPAGRRGWAHQTLRLRVEREAPPKSRARARKGSVTTVATAPPIWRRTSAIARNTSFPFPLPATPAGSGPGTSATARHAPSHPGRSFSRRTGRPPGAPCGAAGRSGGCVVVRRCR
ncbi:hypothetical protein CLM62_08185 [Streptomyces sp. SA15]|nr:hypothetical protein CLM62_08185 [Streptomyces sp. SA15]